MCRGDYPGVGTCPEHGMMTGAYPQVSMGGGYSDELYWHEASGWLDINHLISAIGALLGHCGTCTLT